MPASPTSFSFATPEDLAPYLERERRADAFAIARFDERAAKVRGLSQYIGERPTPRSEAELASAAQRAYSEARAYRTSPRGIAHAKLHAAQAKAGAILGKITAMQASVSDDGAFCADSAEKALTLSAELQVALTELSVLARRAGAEVRA